MVILERQKEKPEEVQKELQEQTEAELDKLRIELERLKKLKQQKDSAKEEEPESKVVSKDEMEAGTLDDIEAKLAEIDNFLTEQLGSIDQETYAANSEYIESQLEVLEQEIIGEKGVIEQEISPYEQLINEYPWLEETRYAFMFSMPNKKKNKSDFESWKSEWAKVLYDYARYAILHIIYLSKLFNEKPFSNFSNRDAVKLIAQELIDQDLAKWLSKKRRILYVFIGKRLIYTATKFMSGPMKMEK